MWIRSSSNKEKRSGAGEVGWINLLNIAFENVSHVWLIHFFHVQYHLLMEEALDIERPLIKIDKRGINTLGVGKIGLARRYYGTRGSCVTCSWWRMYHRVEWTSSWGGCTIRRDSGKNWGYPKADFRWKIERLFSKLRADVIYWADRFKSSMKKIISLPTGAM